MAQSEESLHPFATLSTLRADDDASFQEHVNYLQDNIIWIFNGTMADGQNFGGEFLYDRRNREGHSPNVKLGGTSYTQITTVNDGFPRPGGYITFGAENSAPFTIDGVTWTNPPGTAFGNAGKTFEFAEPGNLGANTVTAYFYQDWPDFNMPIVSDSGVMHSHTLIEDWNLQLQGDYLASRVKHGFAAEEAKRRSDAIPSIFDDTIRGTELKNEIYLNAADRKLDTTALQIKANSLVGLALSMPGSLFTTSLGMIAAEADITSYRQYQHLNALANDPPDSNFLEVVQPSGERLDFGFAEALAGLGEDFAGLGTGLDEAFATFSFGLENEERLLITLERVQGAALAKNAQGIVLQANAATSIFSELESSFLLASNQFSSLANIFGPNNPDLMDVLLQMSELSGLSRPSSIFGLSEPIPDTNPPTASVPDTGSSVLLLGIALTAIGCARHKFNV